MADTDLLPARGVPALALVDSTGIASNGSQTVAQLAARGIRSVCAVDANGISLSGASVAQLASSGIRAFCPVDENGLAQDAVSTADILRRRGIRPMVLLNNTGVALTGSANVATLAQRGLQSFCPVDEAGNATTMGAVILVSNTTVLDTATIGSNVGTLSVAGGTGTYTFTLTSNPGSLFATAGTNGVNLNVAAALTAGIKPITVQAAGGVPTPISRTINITVTQSPTLPVNTVAPVIAGTPQEGQTLTVTNSGTWTGFPAPGFTYQWNRNAVVVAAVWDTATATAVTLSGGNLVATNTGTTSTSQGAHAAITSGKTSGKYYFEGTFTTIVSGGGGNNGIGVGTTASTYTNMGNSATTGTEFFSNTGNTYSNGSLVAAANLGTRATGDVAGLAIDLDNRKYWVKKVSGTPTNWNNSGTADPATNVGGVTIPAGTMIPFVTFGGSGGTANNVITANFGASAFTGAVPSGFTAGWQA